LAGYTLGDGSVESLTPLQHDFIILVEIWRLKRNMQLAGFDIEEQKPKEMTVTEYADMIERIRKNNPGALEQMT